MFVVEAGIYKARLRNDNDLNVDSFIYKLLEEKFSFTSWIFNPFTKKNEPVKTMLFENNEFYTGLSNSIKNSILEMGYDCRIEYDYNNICDDNPKLAVERIKTGLTIPMRQYQVEATIKAIKKPFTMISLPTGTGKSLVISALLLADNTETIIIVDSKTLMTQLSENIRTFTGIKCGLVGDGNFAPKKWTVAIIDSLSGQRGEDFIRNCNAIYFDECHHAAADSYRRIVDIGKDNILIRRGFSGTAFRNDNRTYLLPALTGPIVYHKTTSEMIDMGYLAKPHIVMPTIANFISKATYYQQIYNSCIINNTYRNKIGIEALVESAKKGNMAVGFVKNVQKHLPIIRNMLYSAFPKNQVGVIHGSVLSINRKRTLAEFAAGDKRILLASVGTTGEGVDLAGEVKIGVNFAGGCSEIAMRQLLGRTLRKPKLDNGEVNVNKPFHVWWVDMYDRTHAEMERQASIRYDIYSSEPSFVMED